MSRPSWLALTFGIVLGLAAGLFYAWKIEPVAYTNTNPASLRADFRMDYLSLIASAYASSGDLDRARARLALFGEADTAPTLGALAQQRLAAGYPEADARALAALAAALGEKPGVLPQASQTRSPSGAVSQAPTPGPTRTVVPTATRSPSATPGAAFQLARQEPLCDDPLAPRIQVQVLDAAGRGVPGVEVLVIWDEGQDRFVTGLKPELGGGFADFAAAADTTYTVQLEAAPAPVTGLKMESCPASEGEATTGSWLLIFAQPER
jgi:hypothetical protein